ncbi:MAG: hypothetical protein EZS28_035005 [Streblomastix strix]|uniref:Uncharacterized protein n=1 Tax=Streblomastix strix TaxID=222440 RepID=A0A5J4UFP0_9EUKA|nr:MAG: hypothetical protein EZS28_035005 [Streblomastix strix]
MFNLPWGFVFAPMTRNFSPFFPHRSQIPLLSPDALTKCQACGALGNNMIQFLDDETSRCPICFKTFQKASRYKSVDKLQHFPELQNAVYDVVLQSEKLPHTAYVSIVVTRAEDVSILTVSRRD